MAEQLSQFLTPALIVLIASSTAVFLSVNWRFLLVGLAVAYVSAAVLATQIALPEVAAARLIAGLLVVAILAISTTQAQGRLADDTPVTPGGVDRLLASGAPFRAMAAVLGLAAAGYLASQPDLVLPGLDGASVINTATYFLMVLGALKLGLTDDPLPTGAALLMLLLGFQLFYAAVEPSLAIVAVLIAVDLGIALAVSYLIILRSGKPDEQPET